MEIKIKDLEKSQKEIEIELSKEEFEVFVEKAYEKVSANMEVKGFRKGKVPRNVIEQNVGKEGVIVEAGDLAVQDSYKKAVLENKLEPISQPEVQIKKIAIGSPLVFTAKFSILPEMNLPDYRKIAEGVKKQEVKVEEKELESTLKWVQRSRAKFTVKQEPAQKGDFVEIEYFSEDIPQISKENKKKDSFILGEGHFIPGFEDLITGMKAGEEKKGVALDIPQDHSFQKIAGKKVTFDVKLNSVQNVEFPEINDEFAKSIGEFADLESLKNNIKQGIKQEKEQAEKQKVRNELVDRIAAETKVEIPDVLVKREQDQMIENFKKDVPQRLNVSYEEYLKKIKKTEEEMKGMLLIQAQKKVKSFLILREIGKREDIQITDEEVNEETNKILKQYPDPKKIGLELSQLKDYTREVLKTEKIFSLLESLIK